MSGDPADEPAVDDPHDVAAAIAALARPLVVVFDCDGVLAPLTDHPDDSTLLDGTRELLAALADQPDTTVAILSGRSLDGLAQFDFPESIGVVGSYGNELRGASGPELDERERELLDRLIDIADRGVGHAGAGAHVEHKPASVVLHVRQADDSRGVEALDRAREAAVALDGAEVHDGSDVVELMARSADKGTAIDAIRRDVGAGSTVYFGDDVPDEEAFARLGPADLSIKVGSGASVADRRLADPDAVQTMLRALTDGLTG